MEGFGKQKQAGTRKSQTKARIISGEVLSFAGRGRLGVCHYGDLTNAGQEIPGCFKMPLLGEAGSAVRVRYEVLVCSCEALYKLFHLGPVLSFL